MICKLCGQRPAKARGLCSACYQIERKAGRLEQYGARQRKQCAFDGCELPASSKGYCKKHAERHRRGTLDRRQVADIPDERWADIAGHPGLMVSTAGRIKSTRAEHERLMRPRWVDGRMLVGDHFLGNITVHLAVLRAFAPQGETDDGKAFFVDGDPKHTALANLRWETTGDRITRAITMAEGSNSRWAADFIAFWRGDREALNTFFSEMRALLFAMYQKKATAWRHYYPLEAGEYAAATLHGLYLSIKRGSLANLDNLTGWVLTAGDNVLRQHHRYAIRLIGMESSDDELTTTVADGIGWTMPSAETCALAREEIFYRNAAANRALPGAL